MIANSELDFDALYSRYSSAAYGLALHMTADHTLAEDAVQESMLRVWRAAPVRRPGNDRGWVLRIVARECMRLQKRRQRERLRAEIANQIQPRNLEAVPYEYADREGSLSRLRAALEKLPARERRLLSLRYENGLSQRRISASAAMPQQTVSNRLRHSLNLLSREMAALSSAS